MWTYEPFIGTTVFFDEARTTSLATTAFWELHGHKEDTNVRVGQILTLEGGVGKSFLKGGLVIGGAYYAQWKLTKDQLAEFVLPGGDPVAAGFSQQAPGVRPWAGRHAADREQVEALCPGQHPLFLGNGRASENRRAESGRYVDLPGSERKA